MPVPELPRHAKGAPASSDLANFFFSLLPMPDRPRLLDFKTSKPRGSRAVLVWQKGRERMCKVTCKSVRCEALVLAPNTPVIRPECYALELERATERAGSSLRSLRPGAAPSWFARAPSAQRVQTRPRQNTNERSRQQTRMLLKLSPLVPAHYSSLQSAARAQIPG
ncbi:hypothetical protein BDY21DRAFT_204531 [Lineolata rhizophorae]|uniref:Uncharacterized protein n=1 Tax=Lineolata rhizophorae TaxID=578093 RepID=A0A6A6P3D2_9PEZI|nr:hypothetical protein BDY21DRAFT_204531 [Lineolata rhizophorae]